MSRSLMDESPPQKDATTAEGAEITNQRREIVIERSAESKCISRGGGIDAENLHEVRYLGEMGHSLAGAGLITDQQIRIEDIFPGTPWNRARFNLTETDLAKCEDAERFEQRSGDICCRKRD